MCDAVHQTGRQFRFFTVPVVNLEVAASELNSFVAQLSLARDLVEAGVESLRTICVTYGELGKGVVAEGSGSGEVKGRLSREMLSDADFALLAQPWPRSKASRRQSSGSILDGLSREQKSGSASWDFGSIPRPSSSALPTALPRGTASVGASQRGWAHRCGDSAAGVLGRAGRVAHADAGRFRAPDPKARGRRLTKFRLTISIGVRIERARSGACGVMLGTTTLATCGRRTGTRTPRPTRTTTSAFVFSERGRGADAPRRIGFSSCPGARQTLGPRGASWSTERAPSLRLFAGRPR